MSKHENIDKVVERTEDSREEIKILSFKVGIFLLRRFAKKI